MVRKSAFFNTTSFSFIRRMNLGEHVCAVCAKISNTLNRSLQKMILSVGTPVQIFSGYTHCAVNAGFNKCNYMGF